MRRLNVREAQIDTCIEKSMFAISFRPHNPELQPGELLLLQLVKGEAKQRDQLKSRINFALVFDHLERDYDGTISRLYWPNAGREWPWIVVGLATVPTVPFSLEDLPLSKSYEGFYNPGTIERKDEGIILPYIQWDLAEIPAPVLPLVPASQVPEKFGRKRALSTIYNHDRIAVLRPVPRKLISTEEFVRNQWLSESLKAYYDCRCQICGRDFYPDYGVAFSETHHIQYLAQGGPDISGNIVVICPNHHRIIHATNARFDRQRLSYEYPNGLREPLIRPDHFVNAPQLSTP